MTGSAPTSRNRPKSSGSGGRLCSRAAALWDLVWAGAITNDTFAPLRGLGRKISTTTRGRRGAGQTLAGGRWSLVSQLTTPGAEPTARALARTQVLPERYGLVSREAAVSEDWVGYGPIHQVLKGMEDAGKVRRGYFVEGLSGSQFAYGGAIERLRATNVGDEAPAEDGAGPEDLLVMAALDPANPYGALLPWPDVPKDHDQRARRVTGAWVVLWRGRPVLYAAQHGRRVSSFGRSNLPAGVTEAAFIRLAQTAMPARRGFLVIEQIDSLPVRESPLHECLRSAGFESDHRGLVAGPSLAMPAR